MLLKSYPADQAAKVAGIRPEAVLGMLIAYTVLLKHGKELCVTSGTEGEHGHASLHFSGQAFDIRTRDWLSSEIQAITDDLKASLGVEYDVVRESNHIHVEFQPKVAV